VTEALPAPPQAAPATAPPADALADKAARLTGARLLTSCIDLVTAVLLVQLLSKERVAVFALLLLLYETAKHVSTLGFPDSVFYFFEKWGRESHRALVRQTSVILTVTGLVAAMVLLALSFAAPYVLTTWAEAPIRELQDLLPFFALVVALEVPTWPLTNVMIATDRVRDASAFQVGSSLLMFGALFGPLALGFDPAYAVYGLVAYAVLRFIATAVWIRAVMPHATMALPPDALRQQLTFALPLGLNVLAGRLNKYIDKYVVAFALPAGATAEYQVGAQELPLITVVPYAVGAVLISRYVALQLEGRHDEVRALWLAAVEKVSMIVVPAAILAIAVAPDFMIVLFASDYAAAIPVFQIYALLTIQRVAQYGAVLQAYGDTRSILRFTAVILALNAIASVPLTLAFGITGTAAATLGAGLVGFWLYQRRIATHLRCRTSEVLPWRHYGLLVVICGVAAAGAAAARHAFVPADAAGLGLLLATAVFVPLYVVSGRATGVLQRADLRTFLRWLSPRFHLGRAAS
jgi:O-antigen/teichoic acid export membrane protein